MLHPTSLPGGRLGPEAYRFVDWLEAAGQSWWQVLPLGPPDKLRSPYASASAFAAWSGFLAEPEARVTKREVDAFRRANAYWARDWERSGQNLADQVRFEREWSALRAYARERGIGLIGDVPIYVAQGSVDQRTHPDLFLEGLVAGAPPDALGPRGQHWGNPLFDWAAVAAEGYRWWIERLRRTFSLFDVVRIDHFRGFARFWAIPAGSKDARKGTLAARPRRGRLPGRGGRARPTAGDRGGSRADHAGRLRAPRPARLPRDGRAHLGVQRAEDEPAPVREPPRARGALHVDARHRHVARQAPAAESLEADRARARVAARPHDDPGAGRARARPREPDEPTRRAVRQLALAARARAADGRPRRAAPGADRGRRQG